MPSLPADISCLWGEGAGRPNEQCRLPGCPCRFFSVSEAVLYMQLTDRLDRALLPLQVSQGGYPGLFRLVSRALYSAHVEGRLKQEIIQVRSGAPGLLFRFLELALGCLRGLPRLFFGEGTRPQKSSLHPYRFRPTAAQHPERFVELDPEAAQTLLDMKQAGKQLLLITNSDFPYTNAIMTHAYDRRVQRRAAGTRPLWSAPLECPLGVPLPALS